MAALPLPDKTTSHSTKLANDASQVAGYDKTTGGTTSHLTSPPEDAGQVIDETTSHLTKAASCQVIGYGYSHSTKLAMALHSQLTNSSEDHE
jgi:hypothetical protein